jgi:AraC-like DNA-binding protein
MKPMIEKLPLTSDASFVARTHRTPNFEVPWHQHTELELILFTEGAGLSFIGNYVGEFEVGDIFFLGPNLPHTFQKSGECITSAVVVHFKENFWGKDFLDLPEIKGINQLLDASLQGLKITGKSKETLNAMIRSLEKNKGFRRMITLFECMDLLAEEKEFISLSTQEVKQLNSKNRERIDRIFQFTMDNFKEPIQLSQVAGIAAMSVPAFCNYFKKSTRKKYIDFLNEIRIGYACKLLLDGQAGIADVCFESGFNTLAHFNKQFMRIKNMTPSKYRKAFMNSSRAEASLLVREME